jgi:predicted glycosyltransferase
VDFVRIPGVVKLRGGDYTPLSEHIDLVRTLELRSSIVAQTAATFAPDLFLVDKEPLGLRGEVAVTLETLRRKGVQTVLGLRDILDDSVLLKADWENRGTPKDLENYFEEIWVFGVKAMGNPLAGLGVSERSKEMMVYTGYLKRTIPVLTKAPISLPTDPFLLVTPGGGGDGETLVDWVLSALESQPRPATPVVIVLGPFMAQTLRRGFQHRVSRLKGVHVITFDANMELLMDRAVGVVAMGGYNTFCEILSLDKRAVLVPRSTPRMEQTLRARRAASLGLIAMLDSEGDRSPQAMSVALRALERQALPSAAGSNALLSGLEVICDRVDTLLGGGSIPHQDIA